MTRRPESDENDRGARQALTDAGAAKWGRTEGHAWEAERSDPPIWVPPADPFAPQCFALQADWLERRRQATLDDLARLKRLLNLVHEKPWEERETHAAELLRQASGCFGTLNRLEDLKRWTG